MNKLATWNFRIYSQRMSPMHRWRLDGEFSNTNGILTKSHFPQLTELSDSLIHIWWKPEMKHTQIPFHYNKAGIADGRNWTNLLISILQSTVLPSYVRYFNKIKGICYLGYRISFGENEILFELCWTCSTRWCRYLCVGLWSALLKVQWPFSPN